MSLLKKRKKIEEKTGFESLANEAGNWLAADYQEGQLSIDVFEENDNLVVKSTIAGVRPDNIDIAINHDMLTIRGRREEMKKVAEENYLYRECYWGSFSRSIILPFEVKTDKIEAELENGILTITLPKARTSKEISIKVKEK
jgi:HSP20 family protein